MKSLKTIAWYTRFAGSLVALTPKFKKATKMKNESDWHVYKPYVDKLVLNWMTPLVEYAGVKYNVEDKDNVPDDEAVLFVVNHQGMFDFPAVLMCLKKPCAFIVKKEASSYPIIKKCLWFMDCVFIDRDNAREALKTLEAAADMIISGRSVAIFPEGTRSKTGEIGEFKSGASKILQKAQCKVVPVLIDGTRHALEETGEIIPAEVRVKVLKPIDTKDMDRKQLKALLPEIRDMLAAEKDRGVSD